MVSIVHTYITHNYYYYYLYTNHQHLLHIYLDPAIPQQADLVCTACKGDVTVSFDLKDDRCTDLKANKPLETKWGEEELFHSEHDQFQVDHMLEPFLLKPLGVAGTHRSLYERCKLLQKEVAGQLALMVEKANARICKFFFLISYAYIYIHLY